MGVLTGQDAAALFLGLCSHYVALDGLDVVERAVVFEGELQCAQRHIVLLQEGQVLRREDIGHLPQAVQFQFIVFVHAHQSVVDEYASVMQLNDIERIQHVIVIIVFFACGEQHGHGATGHEYGMAQRVAHVLAPEVDGILTAGIVAGGVLLHTVEAVLTARELPDVQRRQGVVDAAPRGDVAILVTTQVEGLAHRSRLEECRVACGIGLRDLELHGIERHLILARHGVGMYDDAVAVGMDQGGVLVVLAVGDLVVALGDVVVQLVADYPRRVVALQLEDDGQGVAQVVVRQAFAQRQQSLVVAAHDATLQGNFCLVPEVDAGEVFLPVHFGRVLIEVDVVAVVEELMALFHGLYGVGTLRDAHREGSLRVRRHGFALGIYHWYAVAQELYARDGNARTLIEDETREVVVEGAGEEDARDEVTGFVEGHRLWLEGTVGAHLQGIGALALVDETVYLEVARGVGHAREFHAALDVQGRSRDGQVRQADAVGQAHIAAHQSRLLAATVHAQATDILALAPRHGLDGVGVVVLRAHGLVDVGRLRVVGLQGVDTFGSHLVAAQDAVEVGLHALPRRPFQRHGTLQGVGLEGGQLHVVLEDVVFERTRVGFGHFQTQGVQRSQCGIALLDMQTELMVEAGVDDFHLQFAALALFLGQFARLSFVGTCNLNGKDIAVCVNVPVLTA